MMLRGNPSEVDLRFTSMVGLLHIGMNYLANELGGAAQLGESAEDGLMRSNIARETIVLRPLCRLVNIRK